MSLGGMKREGRCLKSTDSYKLNIIPTFSLITNQTPMQQRLIWLTCLGIFFWSCNSSQPQEQEVSALDSVTTSEAARRILDTTQTRSVAPREDATPLPVEDVASVVLQALKEKDWETVADYVHSSQGVCFTPEVYVSDKDQTLMADQLRSADVRNKKRNWGDMYGEETGSKLQTLDEYYSRYIMDVDFTKAEEVNFNKDVQRGNSINNARTAFEAPYIVEYYIPGVNPDFGGMDWRSLRLVFGKDGNGWGLVGVIHGAWTP